MGSSSSKIGECSHKSAYFSIAEATKKYHYDREAIFRDHQYQEHDIEMNKDHIDWKYVSQYQKLSKAFVVRYRNRIVLNSLLLNQHLTEDIIDELIDDFVKAYVCGYEQQILHMLATKILHHDNNHHSLNYHKDRILRHYKFSESDLEKVDIRRYSRTLSEFQSLTETFMDRHKDILDWKLISRHQILLSYFIKDHQDLINWRELSYNKNLTFDVASIYRDKLIETEEVENARQPKNVSRVWNAYKKLN